MATSTPSRRHAVGYTCAQLMGGVCITPLLVGDSIATGVSVTVNGSVLPGSSLSQSVAPQVLCSGGVTVTSIQSSS